MEFVLTVLRSLSLSLSLSHVKYFMTILLAANPWLLCRAGPQHVADLVDHDAHQRLQDFGHLASIIRCSVCCADIEVLLGVDDRAASLLMSVI